MANIMVIDDEINIRKTLSMCLQSEGHSVFACENGETALKEIREQIFDLALVDLRLGNENGLDLIEKLRVFSPDIKVSVITAYASIDSAVEAIKRGACDYLSKPFSPGQVKLHCKKILETRKLEREVDLLKEDLKKLQIPDLTESQHPTMQTMLETARKAAESEAIILLQGESGTGKSSLARVIHQWSGRAKQPFGLIACPSLPAELLESELFGHVRGSFTGAVRDQEGKIAACEGGTLFLDEIGAMSGAVQSKMLCFIQDKEYQRIGETRTRKANVRLIAATNQDLAKSVAVGAFREDLYYRLNVISLTLLPLRERPADILPLAEGFLHHFCRVNKKSPMQLSQTSMKQLMAYSWPGNIRELRNAIERAVILANRSKIEPWDLPGSLKNRQEPFQVGDFVSLSRLEKEHIRRVLERTATLGEAAEILEIDQATLWRKRKLLDL